MSQILLMKKRIESVLSHWELPQFDLLEFKTKKTKYCICIPVKNEGDKIKKQLIKMKKYSSLADILILDWGSIDGSVEPEFLKAQGVRALLIKKSFGKQATQLRMGFAYALRQGYKGIIQIDGNNKDGLEAIPSFIDALEDGFDYIQGSRFIKGGKAINTPFIRLIGIRFLASPLLSLAAKYWYTDLTNGFRAYSRNYLLHPKVKPFRNVFIGYSLNFYLSIRASQLGFKTQEIPVLRKYPLGQTPTKINGLKAQFEMLMEQVKTAIGFYNC